VASDVIDTAAGRTTWRLEASKNNNLQVYGDQAAVSLTAIANPRNRDDWA